MSEIPSEEKQEVLDNSSEHEVEAQCEEAAKIEIRQVVAEVIQSEFSGPIPPPNIISGYEEVLPGSADRIIRMAEKQSEHRQYIEKRAVDSESRDSLLGVLFAFILGIGCIAAAIVIVIAVPQNSGAIASAIIGATGIGSIIMTFINSTRGSYGYKNRSNNKSSEKTK